DSLQHHRLAHHPHPAVSGGRRSVMIRDESSDRRQERAPAWLGPIRVPTRLAGLLRRSVEGLATQLGPWPVWLLVGALAGALPLALDYLLGCSQSRWTTPLLVTPLLLAAV